MSTTVAVIAGCAIVTYVIKGIGPLALGGRELPAVVHERRDPARARRCSPRSS